MLRGQQVDQRPRFCGQPLHLRVGQGAQEEAEFGVPRAHLLPDGPGRVFQGLQGLAAPREPVGRAGFRGHGFQLDQGPFGLPVGPVEVREAQFGQAFQVLAPALESLSQQEGPAGL